MKQGKTETGDAPAQDAPLNGFDLLPLDRGILKLGDRTFATPEALAKRLGKTTRTLARWEDLRIGPPRSKVGSLVLYDLSKLAAWLETHETAAALNRPPTTRRPQ